MHKQACYDSFLQGGTTSNKNMGKTKKSQWRNVCSAERHSCFQCAYYSFCLCAHACGWLDFCASSTSLQSLHSVCSKCVACVCMQRNLTNCGYISSFPHACTCQDSPKNVYARKGMWDCAVTGNTQD